jgi:hypothetical protein
MSVPDGRPSVRASSQAPTPVGSEPKPENKRLRMAALVVFLIAAAGVAAVLSRRATSEPSAQPAAVAPTPVPSVPKTPEPPVPEAPQAQPPEQPANTVASDTTAALDQDAGQIIHEPSADQAAAHSTLQKPEPNDSRRRDRSRAGKDSASPLSAPPKPESNDDALHNFGGRR